jgi:hypothetical protein
MQPRGGEGAGDGFLVRIDHPRGDGLIDRALDVGGERAPGWMSVANEPPAFWEIEALMAANTPDISSASPET